MTRPKKLKQLKKWPSWVLMLLLTASLLAVGTTRSSGPKTQAERIDAITKRLACPTCDGESVFVSRASAAEAIRNQVARDVSAGQLTDEQIIGNIADRFRAQVLLVPRATGFDSLVWVIPMVVLACALGGLFVAFRRWRSQLSMSASEDDYAIVDTLLRQETTERDV